MDVSILEAHKYNHRLAYYYTTFQFTLPEMLKFGDGKFCAYLPNDTTIKIQPFSQGIISMFIAIYRQELFNSMVKEGNQRCQGTHMYTDVTLIAVNEHLMILHKPL